MNIHADKTQENGSRSVANAVSQKQSSNKSKFQFVDNRPEAIAQRKIQEMANNNLQINQLRASFPAIVNNDSIRRGLLINENENNIGSSGKAQQQEFPVQRMIAINNPNVVYSQNMVDTRSQAGINILLGGNYNFLNRNWNQIKTIIWTGGTVGAPLQEVHNKYQHTRNIYCYPDIFSAQNDEGATIHKLLLPADMQETGDPLPVVLAPASACVIQVLVDFGVAAPTGATTDQAWHSWCRGQGLDYRTDSDIIRIYVGHLGYSLVNNTTVTMNNVNWEELGGDGDYLVAAYVGMPAGVGHMIGVVINHGAIQTVHDRQNLIAPTLNNNPAGVSARYIYRI